MAGAVAGVTTIKNPITGAYAVMMKSEHVMLAGKGAEEFAERQGLEIVLPSYFFDSTRYEQWLRVKEKEGTSHVMEDEKFGTVGCVALDQYGNLAALNKGESSITLMVATTASTLVPPFSSMA